MINKQGHLNRYLSQDGLDIAIKFGIIKGYATTIDSNISSEIPKDAQIKPEWGMPKYRAIIPSEEVKALRIARPFGNTAPHGWEFFTRAYPEAGPGDGLK